MPCMWVLASSYRKYQEAMLFMHRQQLISERYLCNKRRSSENCRMVAERKEDAIISVSMSSWEWVAFDEEGSGEEEVSNLCKGVLHPPLQEGFKNVGAAARRPYIFKSNLRG